jgi:hypothetical protein
MKKVYLSIVYLTVKAFKFHCQKTVTLALPRCAEVFVVTEAERFGFSARLSVLAASQQSPAPPFLPRVPEKKKSFSCSVFG